jgi:group I intron endonuclease
MGIIYKLTSPSGKSYIGQTIQDLATRIAQHVKMSKLDETSNCKGIHRAIRKYGIKSFSIDTVKVCENDELNEYEKTYISELNTLSPNGYNLTTGGDSDYKVSEYTRAKISSIVKKRHGISELPMYIGTVKKNGEIIGYKVRCHPRNPKQRKFICKVDIEKAYTECLEYLTYLDSLDCDEIETNVSLGRRRGDQTSSLPKHMYAIKEGELVVGYFIQGHSSIQARKKFHNKKNPDEARIKAENFLSSLNESKVQRLDDSG